MLVVFVVHVPACLLVRGGGDGHVTLGDPLALSSSSMLAAWRNGGRGRVGQRLDCDTHQSSIMLSLKIKKGMVRLVFLPCHFPPSTPCATHVFHECSHTLWACALQILVDGWLSVRNAERPFGSMDFREPIN